MSDKWDERFMRIAEETATWSKDPSTQVGALIVDPDRRSPVAHGYNGPVRGYSSDDLLSSMARDKRLLISEHAERNAIYNAAFKGVQTEGCTLYGTHPPCIDCARGMIQSGIRRFVYRKNDAFSQKWDASESLGLLKCVGVEVTELE